MFGVAVPKSQEVFMTNPKLSIVHGPGQQDLELAFAARHLGAEAKFTIFINVARMEVRYKILNLSFVTCQGNHYELGGQLVGLGVQTPVARVVGPFNFVNVSYNTVERTGKMEFSNAE